MGKGDLLHDCQTQTASSAMLSIARCITTIKTIEHMFHILLTQANASIVNADPNPIRRRL
jgi:hypothetical protein